MSAHPVGDQVEAPGVVHQERVLVLLSNLTHVGRTKRHKIHVQPFSNPFSPWSGRRPGRARLHLPLKATLPMRRLGEPISPKNLRSDPTASTRLNSLPTWPESTPPVTGAPRSPRSTRGPH